MSPTDELRRMLDERGVEWDYGITGATTTRFSVNGIDLTFTPMRDGLVCSTILTPAQAIAATLGETDKGCYLMRDGKKFPVELDYGFLGIMPIAITVGGLRYLIEVPNEE